MADGSSQDGDKPVLPTRVPFAGPYPGSTSPPPPRRTQPTIGRILAARTGSPPPETAPPVTPPPKRKIWVRVLAAAAVLVAGSLWWWPHTRTATEAAPPIAPPEASSAPPETAARAGVGATAIPSAAPAPPAAAPSPPALPTMPAVPKKTATPKASANTSGRNLALRSTATSSSIEGEPWAPANAVDGDPATRWSSGFSDPQWLRLDLGARWQVSEITLNWENAHATNYRVEVSTDGKAWTAVYRTSAGRAGPIVVDAGRRPARYVRMYGTERSTTYGYSLLEIEVR